jgi:hypothetical protein
MVTPLADWLRRDTIVTCEQRHDKVILEEWPGLSGGRDGRLVRSRRLRRGPAGEVILNGAHHEGEGAGAGADVYK